MLAKRSELFQLASAAFLKWDARFLNGKRGGKIKAGRRGELYIQLLPAAVGCKPFNLFPFLRLVRIVSLARGSKFCNICCTFRYVGFLFLTHTRLTERQQIPKLHITGGICSQTYKFEELRALTRRKSTIIAHIAYHVAKTLLFQPRGRCSPRPDLTRLA